MPNLKEDIPNVLFYSMNRLAPGATTHGPGRRTSELLGWAGIPALGISYTQFNEFQPLLYRGILLTALAGRPSSPSDPIPAKHSRNQRSRARDGQHSYGGHLHGCGARTQDGGCAGSRGNYRFEEAVFDQVMKTLLAHRVERVMFINVHRPVGPGSYLIRIFDQSQSRGPPAELMDRDTIAHGEQG